MNRLNKATFFSVATKSGIKNDLNLLKIKVIDSPIKSIYFIGIPLHWVVFTMSFYSEETNNMKQGTAYCALKSSFFALLSSVVWPAVDVGIAFFD